MEMARESLSQGLAGLPRFTKLKDGRILPVDEIGIGSVIILCVGDVVPIDGLVVSGVASIDESSATGESWPKDKKEGEKVMAGSMVQNGYLEVQTTEKAKDSYAQTLQDLVETAQQTHSQTEADIDHFSK
mmetsp:Transcript_49605/g.41844  ORF Transcript_49605/g.41844 Transcript_49605/m.41844 type:complete len:130 (+) Transcript_49605:201-590(+)